jgi:hypothetical protein
MAQTLRSITLILERTCLSICHGRKFLIRLQFLRMSSLQPSTSPPGAYLRTPAEAAARADSRGRFATCRVAGPHQALPDKLEFTPVVVVDGLRLVVDVQSNSARVTLTEEDHVYLFATRDRADGKWRVNPLDVFKVVNGAVVAPDDFNDIPKSVPVDTFVQKLYQLQPAPALRP